MRKRLLMGFAIKGMLEKKSIKRWTLLSTVLGEEVPLSVRKTVHMNSHDVMMQNCQSVCSLLLADVYFPLRKYFFYPEISTWNPTI